MLSYEFFTLQNRFTNRIYRSEVRTVQRHQETGCSASLFFQLSTQWRSNCSWVFTLGSHAFQKQINGYIPNCLTYQSTILS